MQHDPFIWRVETACRNAWPAREEHVWPEWVIRRSGGTTKRTNSVNPLDAFSHPLDEVLLTAAQCYGDAGQDVIVRVPSFLPELGPELATRGFNEEAVTLTLVADLEGAAAAADPDVHVSSGLSDTWKTAKARISSMQDDQYAIYEDMLERIEGDRRFASIEANGEVAALAYGVIDQDLLVIESVATDPAHRRQGLAGKVVSALLAWGQTERVEFAALQVEADNETARNLYLRLGFYLELYRYSYFRKAATS